MQINRLKSMKKELPKRSVFRLLLVIMLSLGTLVGTVFPPYVNVALNAQNALSVLFFAMCIFAGLLIGLLNYIAFHLIVTREIHRVLRGMDAIIEGISLSEKIGEHSGFQHIEVNSNDAIGEMALGFNEMTGTIGNRIRTETFTQSLLSRLSSSVELDQVSETILTSLMDVLHSEAGALYGVKSGNIEYLTCIGIDRTDELPRELDRSFGPVKRVQKTDEVMTLKLGEEDFRWFHLSTPLGSFQPNTVSVIPMLVEKRLAGLAFVSHSSHPLDDNWNTLLDIVRIQSAPYLQNAVLHEKIKEIAAIDELTQILNRRFGMRRLREEFSRCMRHGIPISVIMSDIDHFKKFNDTYGHDAGDAVLRSVARTMDDQCRAGDVVCRYGGEEFLIVLPGTGTKDAARIIERIRRIVETTDVPWGQQQLSVNLSLGISTWPVVRVSTPEEIISDADKVLYFAKENGRNMVALNDGENILPYDASGEEV